MPVPWLLAVAACIEAATGIGLIVVPSTVGWLLLGEGLSGAGLSVGRVAGVALLALGAGGWIGRRDHGRNSAVAAILIYNILAAGYLAYLGVEGGHTGTLLWPAVAIHAVLGVLLVHAWFSRQAGSLK